MGLLKIMVKSDLVPCVNVTEGCAGMFMFANHCLNVSKLVVIEVDKSTKVV